MILTELFSAFFSLIHNLLNLFNIPHLPEGLTTSFRSFLNLVFNNLSLLGLVFRPTSFKSFCALAIVLLNFEHIYGFAMYVYHKVFNRV